MYKEKRTAIIISASSDIGTAMCHRWMDRGWELYGTYRTSSPAVEAMAKMGVKLVSCDLSDEGSVNDACSKLRSSCPQWDVLVLCPGTQEPVGAFSETGFDSWEESIKVNFSSQLRIVHELLSERAKAVIHGPIVLFFAGGGTNNATLSYSAYTISKLALIKMTELLDAEIPDTRFTIVGPGWVKTKIHDATLNAGEKAGANYQRTIDKLAGNECTDVEDVLDCCDWLIDAPREVVSGRNFSVVFDRWGTDELTEMLTKNPDMYKLRRFGNDWLVNK